LDFIMSDLTINTTLRDANSIANRSAPAEKSSESPPTAAPSKVSKPSEVHSSPKGTIESNSGLFVIQFRDGDGTVKMQYPAKKAAHEYEKSSSEAPQGNSQGSGVDPTNNPSEASESA